MLITRGRDGRYSATATGAMARVVVADGETMYKAVVECEHMLHLQEAESYHYEQAMTHQSMYGECK